MATGAAPGFFGGIGQGFVAATPIQMANIAATIARRGIWMRPHLVAPDPATGQSPPLRPGAMEGPDVGRPSPGSQGGCRMPPGDDQCGRWHWAAPDGWRI